MGPAKEALLISALVNTRDVTAAQAYGIEPQMMAGYQVEYRWLLSYHQTYGTSPSKEALVAKFKGFPLTNHEDVSWWADEVLYSHQKRVAAETIRTAAYQIAEDDLDEAVLTLGSFRVIGRPQPLTNSLHDWGVLDNYDEKVQALDTPWQTVNRLTGGIRVGNYWTIAARYGQGKSWLLASLMAHQLMQGTDVLFYSLEMTKNEVLPRIHVLLGALLGMDVNHVAMRDRIYDPVMYQKILGAIKEQVPGQLFIQDKGKVTSARVAAESQGVPLTVVDYVGLMHTNTGQPAVGDWRNMATISNQLKEAAISAEGRLVVAAQINREGDKEGTAPPRSKNLSQSDAIGQDSDVILMTKRFGVNSTIWCLDKNRHGVSSKFFYSWFLPNVGEFMEIPKEKAEKDQYDNGGYNDISDD